MGDDYAYIGHALGKYSTGRPITHPYAIYAYVNYNKTSLKQIIVNFPTNYIL